MTATPDEPAPSRLTRAASTRRRRRRRRPRPRPRRPAEVGPEQAREALIALRQEVGKAVIGQDAVVTGLVIALLCRGHVLLEGVPGVAKTLLVRAVAASLSLDTKRVQFTPDLMPGDITGSLVYDSGDFSFRAGSGVHQPAARRRDQPHAAQDPGLAARGDGGAAGDRRRHAPRRCPTRSWCARRRTRSSTRAPTRCPRRSSTASCSSCTVGLPSREDEVQVLAAHDRGFDPRDLAAAGLRPVAGAAELAAGRAAVQAVHGRARGARVRRRPVPGHPHQPVAVARASRPAARRPCWRPPRRGRGCPRATT